MLPYAEGEPEEWGSLSDGGVRERSRELNALFRELDGAPVFADWSRHELFAADIREILPSLARGKDNPRGLTEDGIGRLLRWTEEDARALWSDGIPVGLNHGDLKGDNLILSPGGRGSSYVIDWQRPLCAPLPLEPALSLLLVRPDTDAANQLSDPFFRLACALEMRWYAWAWQTCLPWPFVRAMAVKYAGMCIM